MSALSNFPFGFAAGVTIRGVPLLQTHTGKVFFVGNGTAFDTDSVGGSNGNPGTFQRPLSTLDYAIGLCQANRGDIIFIKPGHAETYSAAAALALDVAGVAVIGLGSGSLRPTFTLDTAITTNITVSAANVHLQNCIISANFADITSVFAVTAKWFTAQACYFKATAVNMNFLALAVTDTTDNSADGLAFIGCSWIEPDLATLQMVTGNGDIDQLTITDGYFNLGVNTNDLPVCAAMATGKDMTNLKVFRNRIIRLNDANPLIASSDTTTANSGFVADNFIRHLDVSGELLVTAATNIGFANNLSTAAVDKSGYPVPAVDS